MDGYRSLAGSAQCLNGNTFLTDPLPTVLCHQHVEPEGGDRGESTKLVIVDLIRGSSHGYGTSRP